MYFIISKTLKKIIFYNIYHEVTTHMRQTTVSVENYYYCYACQKIDLMAFHVKNNVISYWIWYFLPFFPVCLNGLFITHFYMRPQPTFTHVLLVIICLIFFSSHVRKTYIHSYSQMICFGYMSKTTLYICLASKNVILTLMYECDCNRHECIKHVFYSYVVTTLSII